MQKSHRLGLCWQSLQQNPVQYCVISSFLTNSQKQSLYKTSLLTLSFYNTIIITCLLFSPGLFILWNLVILHVSLSLAHTYGDYPLCTTQLPLHVAWPTYYNQLVNIMILIYARTAKQKQKNCIGWAGKSDHFLILLITPVPWLSWVTPHTFNKLSVWVPQIWYILTWQSGSSNFMQMTTALYRIILQGLWKHAEAWHFSAEKTCFEWKHDNEYEFVPCTVK